MASCRLDTIWSGWESNRAVQSHVVSNCAFLCRRVSCRKRRRNKTTYRTCFDTKHAGTKGHNLSRRAIVLPCSIRIRFRSCRVCHSPPNPTPFTFRPQSGCIRRRVSNRTSCQIVPFCAGVFRVENGLGIKQLIGLVSTRNTPAQKGTI